MSADIQSNIKPYLSFSKWKASLQIGPNKKPPIWKIIVTEFTDCSEEILKENYKNVPEEVHQVLHYPQSIDGVALFELEKGVFYY